MENTNKSIWKHRLVTALYIAQFRLACHVAVIRNENNNYHWIKILVWTEIYNTGESADT